MPVTVWYRHEVRRNVQLAAAVIASAWMCTPVVPAGAAQPECHTTFNWKAPTDDEWTFQYCRDDTMHVSRHGGPAGDCYNEYPVGSWYAGPEGDCGYYGPT